MGGWNPPGGDLKLDRLDDESRTLTKFATEKHPARFRDSTLSAATCGEPSLASLMYGIGPRQTNMVWLSDTGRNEAIFLFRCVSIQSAVD